MAAKVLNIEIGDRLTKVCMSVPKGKTYQINASFMFQTPENSVQDGNIVSAETLAEELASQIRSHGLTDVKNVIFTISSGKIATREVMLPLVKDARLKGIVDSNAADYFPVDLSKYHITYSILERIEKGENPGCRLLVMAAPLSLLEGYFKLADKVKLNIQSIDFSGNSQYQAIKNIGSGQVVMYVNVDCTSSFVTFLQGSNLLLQRAFTFGGDDLVISYMTAAGKATEEYVSALKECSVPREQFLAASSLSADELNDNVSRVVSSIVRSSDYFNSNHWDVQVEKVVLMGPCGHLAGLIESVASATGLETTYLDNIPGITSFANSIESASFFISCIGSSIAPVDFLPPQFIADKKRMGKSEQADSITGGIVILAVCLVAAIVLSFAALMNYYNARHDKAVLESEIANLEYTRDAYNSYVQYQAGADALIELDSTIDSPNDDLAAFINELEVKMPSNILLLSAVCTRDGVNMNINVPSYKEVAVVLVQLRTFESIKDIIISDVTETQDETGGTYVSFSVGCFYSAGEEELVEEIEPQDGEEPVEESGEVPTDETGITE